VLGDLGGSKSRESRFELLLGALRGSVSNFSAFIGGRMLYAA
jgi:hypothetical protein